MSHQYLYFKLLLRNNLLIDLDEYELIDTKEQGFRSTGIQVAVQGIETAKQLEIAKKAGADLLQGNHLAQPGFAATFRGQFCRGKQLAA